MNTHQPHNFMVAKIVRHQIIYSGDRNQNLIIDL